MFSSHIMAIDLLQIFTSMRCLSVYSVFSDTSQTYGIQSYLHDTVLSATSLRVSGILFSLPRKVDHRNSLK